jgi:hypothetical protein
VSTGKRCVRKESGIHSVESRADAELISSFIHFAVRDYQLEHLLALHWAAGFILQGSHDPLSPHPMISPVEL